MNIYLKLPLLFLLFLVSFVAHSQDYNIENFQGITYITDKTNSIKYTIEKLPDGSYGALSGNKIIFRYVLFNGNIQIIDDSSNKIIFTAEKANNNNILIQDATDVSKSFEIRNDEYGNSYLRKLGNNDIISTTSTNPDGSKSIFVNNSKTNQTANPKNNNTYISSIANESKVVENVNYNYNSKSVGANKTLIEGAGKAAPKYVNYGKSFSDGFNSSFNSAGGNFTPIGERRGNRGVGLSVGYNDAVTLGLDLFFNKFMIGGHYGSRIIEDTLDTYQTQTEAAATLGYLVTKKMYIKIGGGVAYDEIPITVDYSTEISYNEDETYLRGGFQWFLKGRVFAFTPEVFYTTTGGVGASIGVAF